MKIIFVAVACRAVYANNADIAYFIQGRTIDCVCSFVLWQLFVYAVVIVILQIYV